MRLNRAGPTIKPTDITELEDLVGLPLPSQYLSFMLRSNGGLPEVSPTTFSISGPPTLGRYIKGELEANAEAGQSRTPEGLVWHHVEDGKTLQLVPYDVHLLTGRHRDIYRCQEQFPETNWFLDQRILPRPQRRDADTSRGNLQVLFRIKGPTEITNVDWNVQALGRRMASDLLPIGSDGSGNVICMALSGSDEGSVYFWNWYEETAPPSYDNLYLVAESFDRFLARLTGAS